MRGKIKLFEKLYEAFKAGCLKTVKNHVKIDENGQKPFTYTYRYPKLYKNAKKLKIVGG